MLIEGEKQADGTTWLNTAGRLGWTMREEGKERKRLATHQESQPGAKKPRDWAV